MNKRTRENVARFIITRVIPDAVDYRKRLWSAHVRGGSEPMRDFMRVYYARLAEAYLMLTGATHNTIHDSVYVWKTMDNYYYIALSTELRCHMKFYKNHILLTIGTYSARFHDSEIIARYEQSLRPRFGITVSDVLHVVDSCITGVQV